MTENIWIAKTGLATGLGVPWMNALAKLWLESRKGKKSPPKQTVTQQSSTSAERAISKLLTAPLYAIAIWMFLIAPGQFADGHVLRGITFLIISSIFVIAAHFTGEWLTGTSKSK